jgi:DNA-directed RNA polymerase specialized sigma54-like protein
MKDNKYLASDWRSLELHQLIAKKINENPLLLNRVTDNLVRWSKMNGGLPQALKEWESIMKDKTWKEIEKIITSDTQNAARLRSSTPFTGILTDEERMEIFNKWSRKSASHPGVSN